jgi:hypothetical protein
MRKVNNNCQYLWQSPWDLFFVCNISKGLLLKWNVFARTSRCRLLWSRSSPIGTVSKLRFLSRRGTQKLSRLYSCKMKLIVVWTSKAFCQNRLIVNVARASQCRLSWPNTSGFYPWIHRWESVSRRAVGPRWHDNVAYTVCRLWQCVMSRSEFGSHRCARVVNGKQ